jgi:hypothetical protein
LFLSILIICVPERTKANAATPRSSSRLRGIPALPPEAYQNPELLKDSNSNVSASIDKIGLLDAAEYFKAKGIVPEYISDGRYKGWVNPDVALKYGIELTEEEFWAKRRWLHETLTDYFYRW